MPRSQPPARLGGSVAVGDCGQASAAIAHTDVPVHLVAGRSAPPKPMDAATDWVLTASPAWPTVSSRIPALAALPRLLGRVATGAAREVIVTSAAALGTPLRMVSALAAGSGAPAAQAPIAHVVEQTSLPVVLVHGFAASPTCWFALRRALRREGRTVASFAYSPWASSVDELADRLTDTVLDLLAVTGADKVHLVGHSLGGVIIAQALTRRRLAGRVD